MAGDAPKMGTHHGVYVVDSEIKRLIDHYPKVLEGRVRARLERIGKTFLADTQQSFVDFSGNPPRTQRRSGRLAKSFRMRTVGKSIRSMRMEIYTNVPYAGILEFGGSFRAKRRQYLRIPLAARLNARGLEKRTKDAYENSFLVAGPGDSYIVMRDNKAGVPTPLAILVRKVRVPAELGFYKRFFERRERYAREVEDEIHYTIQVMNHG